MKTSIRWFVEISRGRCQAIRIEASGSLREAREFAERAKAEAGFDPATDGIAIYRGDSWHTAKFCE